MANRFLNQIGLDHLIEKIQSYTLTTQDYSQVKSGGNDSTSGSAFFLQVKIIEPTKPWIVKYKISTNLESDSNSEQLSDVLIGGIGKELQFYQVNNIIYDIGRAGCSNSTIFLTDSIFNIGLDFSKTYTENHSVTIELQFLRNCVVAFYETPRYMRDIATEEDLTNGSFKLLNFSEFGIFSSVEAEQQDLADVAYSGSYNDLIDKPDLLNVKIDDDDTDGNVIFYMKGSNT